MSHFGHGTFETTTTSAFVFYDIDLTPPSMIEGQSFFVTVYLSSGETAVTEERAHQSITQCIAQRIDGATTITAQAVQLRSNDFIVVEFSVSGSLLRIAVNPTGSGNWRHCYQISIRSKLDLERP